MEKVRASGRSATANAQLTTTTSKVLPLVQRAFHLSFGATTFASYWRPWSSMIVSNHPKTIKNHQKHSKTNKNHQQKPSKTNSFAYDLLCKSVHPAPGPSYETWPRNEVHSWIAEASAEICCHGSRSTKTSENGERNMGLVKQVQDGYLNVQDMYISISGKKHNPREILTLQGIGGICATDNSFDTFMACFFELWIWNISYSLRIQAHTIHINSFCIGFQTLLRIQTWKCCQSKVSTLECHGCGHRALQFRLLRLGGGLQ